MTWDVPTEFDCPECGQTMFKKSGRGRMKPFCINPDCPNFLPEDQRGYRKKAETQPVENAPGAPQPVATPEDSQKKSRKRKTAKKVENA